jgi:hypothetical protein
MRVLTGLAACLVLATAIAGSTPFGTGHGVHRDVPLHLVLPHTHMTRDGAVVSHSPHVVNQAPNAASSSTADQSGRALGGEAGAAKGAGSATGQALIALPQVLLDNGTAVRLPDAPTASLAAVWRDGPAAPPPRTVA